MSSSRAFMTEITNVERRKGEKGIDLQWEMKIV